MPRFYIPLELIIGAIITLPDKVAHHCQVLRLKIGDPIVLFNGTGGSFIASLTSMDKKSAMAEVKTFDPREAELNYALTLAQALPEASKMDSIIEKAVELGVTGIQPLAAQRCVTKLSGERAEKRRTHWQAIIEAASEQCGRNRLAHLSNVQSFSNWINQQDLHRRLILTPGAEQSLPDWARHHPAQAVTIMIGPEGGFTDDELQLACNQGAIPLSMGERILRTETAGICAVAILNSHWDKM
jgi:16S rRNA (uracil1498-N3)-methyltransferase